MVYSGEEARAYRRSDFQNLKSARDKIVMTVDMPAASELVVFLANKIIKPNLLVNDDKLKELTEMRMNDIPSVSGEVLKNEVITPVTSGSVKPISTDLIR